MKKNRHEAILNLIEKEEVGTQDELLQKLNELGYKVTQATVSRDIKQLKLIKTPGKSGQYRYSCANNDTEDRSGKYHSILTHSVISVDFAGNIAVIKCYSGMAQAACAAVDSLNPENVVGTLAGDDTIFLLCKTEQSASELKEYIGSIINK
ncbi:MAG: arginine repressor [Clostridia bacterium]|nr:arginine repressor [Clostridia bacterium]